MPNKSNPAHSLPSSPQSLPGSSDSNSRMADIAVRKKKNADAQAAFRARRANYIATLEDTGLNTLHSRAIIGAYFIAVTSLESVVLQLQDSCRESRSDLTELRQENSRLRHEFRERENFWRALWQARKSGQGRGADDLPPLPNTVSPSHSRHNLSTAQVNNTNNQYSDEGMGYKPSNDPSASLCSPYNTSAPTQTYSNQSPSYTSTNEQIPSEGPSQLNSHRVASKYGYTYPMHNGSHRDGQWQSPSNGDSGAQAVNGSPTYVTSPTLTSPSLTSSEMSYVHHRYPVEDQKIPLNNLDTAPYVFPNSRSLSPTASTPPSSSSTTSLTSTFQFNFSEASVPQERPEFNYRRHSSAHGQVPLHAGGPEISLAGPGSDAVRHRIGARRANSGSEHNMLASRPPFSGSDGSLNDRGSSEGEAGPYTAHQRPRTRRDTVGSSRSPSPSSPPISGTLAVIKAQAFGALRRNRTKQKKSSENASRAAMEALESRGLGMGLGVGTGSKRQRLEADDRDMQQ